MGPVPELGTFLRAGAGSGLVPGSGPARGGSPAPPSPRRPRPGSTARRAQPMGGGAAGTRRARPRSRHPPRAAGVGGEGVPRLLPPPRTAAPANQRRRLIGPMSGGVSAARGGWSARPGAATARAPRARAGPRDPRSPQRRPQTPPSPRSMRRGRPSRRPRSAAGLPLAR